MLIHRTGAGIDTRADDSPEDDVARHGGAAAAADLGLDDDGAALVAWLGDEDGEGIPAADLEARRRAGDLTSGKPDLGVLRSRINDEDLLGTAGDGSAAKEGKRQWNNEEVVCFHGLERIAKVAKKGPGTCRARSVL